MSVSTPTHALSIGERFASSWGLFKTSWRVVRSEPALLGLTLISILAKVVVFFGLLAAVLAIFIPAALGSLMSGELADTAVPFLFCTVLFIFVWTILLSGALSAFFGGAIAHAAMERIEGRNASIGVSLAAARKRVRALTVFGIITGVVHALTERNSNDNSAVGGVIDSAINVAQTAARELYRLLTSLALPAIMREGIGGTAAIGRSTDIVRAVWPQAVASGFGVRFFTGLLSALPILLIVAAFLLASGGVPTTGAINPDGSQELDLGALLAVLPALLPLIATCIAASVLITTLGGLLEAVYNAALYLYATTGRAGEFSPEELAGAAVTSDGVVKPGAAKGA